MKADNSCLVIMEHYFNKYIWDRDESARCWKKTWKPSFSSRLEQVWHILLPNILLKKRGNPLIKGKLSFLLRLHRNVLKYSLIYFILDFCEITFQYWHKQNSIKCNYMQSCTDWQGSILMIIIFLINHKIPNWMLVERGLIALNEQFFSNSMARTSYIIWDGSDVCFVLDQHILLNFSSARSLKQQSVGRHVTPLGHILILIQPVFALTP